MKDNKRIKSFIKLVIIITIILSLLLVVLISPIFSILEINVVNNNKVTEEEIILLSRYKHRR